MTRSYWGWGHVEEALSSEQRSRLALLLSTRMDVSALAPLVPRALGDLELPAPRIAASGSLAAIVSNAAADRASHCYGKAYRDLVRALRGDFAVAPDLIARPRDEQDLSALFDWCGAQQIALIPYGGGTSVVGGVEARVEGSRGAVSVDLGLFSGIREIDKSSRAALIAAGTFGPDIETSLRAHDLTLRHYPQSFEMSTLGGWLATRAGGHFATLYTHIDDLCESLAVVTPAGRIETRRLPASGAGPAPERLFLGSEGTLGIITSAWMRVQQRPKFRSSAALRLHDIYRAAEAARAIAQAGLFPANCRVLDPDEALINGLGDGSSAHLLIAFESSDHPLDAWLARAVDIGRSFGATIDVGSKSALPIDPPSTDAETDTAQRWKKMFLRAPYLRDALVELGVVTETFETAITWDRFETFHRKVIGAARDAVRRICGTGIVSSRITHVYPDGAAPYFTVLAPARPQSHLEQWDEIKAAVSEVILEGGGTITHHHAVGRDHRPWYDRERPELFAAALRAAKAKLDPAGILNPGVLF
jgi:alkyldihydroxyacetonephosphate synthase